MLIKQTIEKKHIKFVWLVVSIIATLIAIEILDSLLISTPPIVRTIGTFLILAIAATYCYRLIYYKLSEYHYNLVGNQLILEKVMGRANHVAFSFYLDDILSFEKYNDTKIPKRDIFTNTRNKSEWYVITFMKNGQNKKLVIEPNYKLRDFLSEKINENANREAN